MTRRLVLFVVVFSLIGAATTFAQSSMGTVVGTVTDSSGGVIPGATVTLTSRDTGIASTRVTNDSGYFTFINVRPGTYELTVELSGFSTAKVPSFAVGVNETVARNVSLQVGATTETVTVTAQSELLQTSSVGLGHVVEQRVIRELPIQGGNFTPLLLLSPGVNPISTAQGPGQNGGSELALGTEGNSGMPGSMFVNASIQGQQNRSKIYYVDGIVNTSVRAGTVRGAARPRLAAGVQGRIAKRQGGIRRRHRRRRQHDVEVGQQPLQRLSLRRVPQREVRRAQSVPRCAGRRAAAVSTEPVREQSRRPAAEEQDVLLRFVRRLAFPRSAGYAPDRARRPRARRRLLADVPSPHDLQPVHDAGRERPAGARSVPGQRDSRRT